MKPSSLIRIYRSFQETYLSPEGWPEGQWPISGKFHPDRFEIVVGAILTQNTNWNNVERALQQMVRENFVEAAGLVRSSLPRLEKAVYSAGFYRQKAQRLKEIARFIVDYPADFYRDVQREELLSIKGIGPETADSILLYACDRPHFVADAYTRRIFTRYGLFSERESYEAVKSFSESRLPADADLYRRFHALIVEHAKRTCRKNPLCERCVIRADCVSANCDL